MGVTGIGIRWTLLSLALSLPYRFLASRYLQPIDVDSVTPWIFYVPGGLLLAIGIPFLAVANRTMRRNFSAGKLCTTGVFALCRNPIYAAWILFIVPGALLFLRDPLLIAVPFLMYGALRIVLPKEEAWLEQQFGEAYLDYKKNVGRILFSRKAIIGLLRD